MNNPSEDAVAVLEQRLRALHQTAHTMLVAAAEMMVYAEQLLPMCSPQAETGFAILTAQEMQSNGWHECAGESL